MSLVDTRIEISSEDLSSTVTWSYNNSELQDSLFETGTEDGIIIPYESLLELYYAMKFMLKKREIIND